ncbi:hypothetical protein CVD28_09315 [Bacillus sp. M6-12]|uniref:GNAT family N-acetyltransferase n=1 Tax=Bacillus sp. M6-12 TaxID=2054166 RepID=UPI000C7599BC|nr:GNAT family N-acetyltransferase [Bacillus sp. M6-12]PLS17882.1 hypothetical protein CVD28_09315 [Bacillus sp. M6-12]
MNKEIVYSLRKTKLIGSTIDLIPYSDKYEREVIRLRNQQVNRYFLNQDFELTLTSQKEWYEKYLGRNNDIYYLVQNKEGNVIGTNALYDIDFKENLCEKGRQIIDPSETLKGPYALEAELMILDIAFNVLGCNQIIAKIRQDNGKVLNMNKRLGLKIKDSVLVREIPYFVLELKKSSYKPDQFKKIIDHWCQRMRILSGGQNDSISRS